MVADGAVSFVLDHPVRARVVRHAFGTTVCVPFESQKAQHTKRKWECITLWTGDMAIPGGFSCILPKARVHMAVFFDKTELMIRSEYPSYRVERVPEHVCKGCSESCILEENGVGDLPLSRKQAAEAMSVHGRRPQ